MKIKIIILISILFFTNNISFANINTNKIYNNFINRIEKEYNIEEEIIYLENIGKNFENIYNKKNNSNYIKNILNELIILNNKQLKDLKDLKYKKLNKNENQKLIEKKIIEKIKKLKTIKHPSYINKLINNNFNYININENNELVKNNQIFKINFSEYYSPNSSNYKLLFNKNKKSIILRKNNEYLLIENYKLEKKIPYSESKKYFLNYITKTKKSFLKNGIYYFYDFKTSLSTKDEYGFYIGNLKKNNLDPKKILVYFDGKNFSFVKDYRVNKLISEKIIKNIKNKEKFLKLIIEDKKYFKNEDYDELFIKLKKYSENLTKNQDKNEKIKNIYTDVIKKLKYFTGNYNNKKEVFSGILSFKNKYSVCDGYTKLFAYMLMFSGIENFEIKKGYVFNSTDFPNIGHAWLKIDNKYYDPTFDDPIGNNGDIKFEKFLFFGLNKDLFYTNRFDYEKKEKIEEYKKYNLEKRKNIVESNLYKLAEKYKNSNLIKIILYKKNKGFKVGEKITIEKLKNKLDYFEVKNDFSFIGKDNKKRRITKIKYFEITNKNINDLIRQLGEDFFKTTLLKYELKNGKFVYYLTIIFEYK